jgi:hypothetical protein
MNNKGNIYYNKDTTDSNNSCHNNTFCDGNMGKVLDSTFGSPV